MKLTQHQEHVPRMEFALAPGVPLWKVAPTHDEYGASLCDFMVLIPRLKSRQVVYVHQAQSHIAGVLAHYSEVVFANMDMHLNVLWVSHRYRPGLMTEIVAAIRQFLPEAVLVAHHTKV